MHISISLFSFFLVRTPVLCFSVDSIIFNITNIKWEFMPHDVSLLTFPCKWAQAKLRMKIWLSFNQFWLSSNSTAQEILRLWWVILQYWEFMREMIIKIRPNHLLLEAGSVILVKCNWILRTVRSHVLQGNLPVLVIAAFTSPEWHYL